MTSAKCCEGRTVVIGRQVKSDRVGNGFLGVGWIHRKWMFTQEDSQLGRGGWEGGLLQV